MSCKFSNTPINLSNIRTTPVAANYENASMAADYIKSVSNVLPDIGIICGSGLSKLVEEIEERKTIPYINIPNFPRTTS